MPIEFLCHHCSTKLRVGDDSAGKQAKCPKCATILDIPGSPVPNAEYPFSKPIGSSGVPALPTGGANPYQAPGAYVPQQKMQFIDGPIYRAAVDPGQVFSRSWDIFTNKFGQCIGAALIYLLGTVIVGGGAVVVVVLLANAISLGGGDEAAVIVVVLGMLLVGLPVMLLAMLLYYNVMRYYLKLCRNEDPGFGILFQYDSRFWPFLLASIGFGLLVAAGYLLCIVPGVYLACMFFAWPYLVLDRGLPVGEAFNLSKELSDGNKMNIFLVMLIYMAINLGASMIPCGIGTILAMPLYILLFLITYLMMAGQYTTTASTMPSYAGTGPTGGGNPFAQ